MALTDTFYDAVKTGNTQRVRIIMENSLLVDPTFSEFEEMKKAAATMKDLYDTDDGKEFEPEKNWDDAYLGKQMVQLVENFSDRRIKHVQDIVRYLYPVKETVKANPSDRSTKTNAGTNRVYETRHTSNESDLGAKVAKGAVVGACIGGVGAAALGVTILGGAVVGAAAGSCLGAVLSDGDK